MTGLGECPRGAQLDLGQGNMTAELVEVLRNTPTEREPPTDTQKFRQIPPFPAVLLLLSRFSSDQVEAARGGSREEPVAFRH